MLWCTGPRERKKNTGAHLVIATLGGDVLGEGGRFRVLIGEPQMSGGWLEAEVLSGCDRKDR